MESGGYAAKLGDRYERRWIVRQLLLLLQERIRGVTVEAVGDDEAGVDVWIDRSAENRDAQQCKVENGSKKEWTLADLKSRGVLDYARQQLERDSNVTYTFVSSVPAIELRELSRSSRDSGGDAEEFFQLQVIQRSQNIAKAFHRLCSYWNLDSDNPDDRARVYFLLKRIFVHIISDDHESREDLRYMAQVSVEGPPDTVINALADYAISEGNLRRCLTTQDIWNELTRLNLLPRRLTADSRLAIRIKELNDEFTESIHPTLVSGKLINRNETRVLIDLLEKDRNIGMTILHGSAGRGKSGVLYELTREIETREIPYLSIRLDRRTIRSSAQQFGIDLGLRESPVRCLADVAAGRQCVLILDQLDALRWTSSHAAECLEVCKEMLREVVAMRQLGTEITIILCCRTFDLEHDPQIRAWLAPTDKRLVSTRIPVEELSDAVVDEVVREIGIDYDRFSARQKELLRTINNLAIWTEVVRSEERSPDFGSQTQLLRVYWQNRFQILESEGISSTDLNALLDRLVDYMENKATLSAPARLIEGHQKIATELQSLGVIRVSCRIVTFAHQTHLDFLIARRALDSLTTEPQAVLVWLGDRSTMNLVRREQLRQLLLLMIDEDPRWFLATVRSILESSAVRFHMKQLTLEVVGQITPTKEILAFVIYLYSQDGWRELIEGEVLSASPEYCRALERSNYLGKWLQSEHASEQRLAFWILRRNYHSCGRIVVKHCDRLLDCGKALPSQIESLLGNDFTSESRDAFKLRLKCARRGASPRYVPWQELVSKKPKRAMLLFAAILKGEFASKSMDSVRTAGYSRREDPSLLALKLVAHDHPTLTCKLLAPLFSKFVRRSFASAGKRFAKGSGRYLRPERPYEPPPSLSKILKEGLAAIAKSDPSAFLGFAEMLDAVPGRIARKLIVESRANLPSAYADDSIGWLLADWRRLSCGSRQKEHRWMPARRLIRSISCNCSDKVFQDLEATLLRYNDPDEIRRSKADLPYVREGHYWNCVGAAQYHLLPALCHKRRSIETIGRIGVLERKFLPLGTDFFLDPGCKGGGVRSPLNRSRLDHMSDGAWIKLITNRKIGPRESDRKATYTKNSVIEVSIEQFAQDLSTASLCDPNRFARLALLIPDNASSKYLSAILHAMDRDRAPSEVPEDRRSIWVPASAASIQALLERPMNLKNQELAMAFCRVISNRDDIAMTDTIIERLCYCCQHEDPLDNELHVRCDVAASECNVEDLESNAINCVRGVAARAISHILYDHPDLLPKFLPAIEHLLDDPHPVVRLASIGICLPVWNFDKSLCVAMFLRASTDDLRIAASRDARQIFNYNFPNSYAELGPIIERMVESPLAEVSEKGAGEVVARWVFFDLFDKSVSQCLNGTVPQRKGAAESLVQLAHDERYSLKCLPLLTQLADDEDESVRGIVNILFRYDNVLEVSGFPEFLREYLKTKSFRDDPSHLVDALNDRKASILDLADVLLTVSSAFLDAWNTNKGEPSRHGWAASHYLVPLTLRLYELAIDNDDALIRQKCLDFWDELLRLRITSGYELAKGLAR